MDRATETENLMTEDGKRTRYAYTVIDIGAQRAATPLDAETLLPGSWPPVMGRATP
jgi:hypothetical protein